MTSTVKKTLLIPKADFDRFKSLHPQHGALVWFVREAIRSYIELNTSDPKELIRLSVGEINLKDD